MALVGLLLGARYINDVHVIQRQYQMAGTKSCIKMGLTVRAARGSIGMRGYSGFGGQLPVDNSGCRPDVCLAELDGTVGDIESAVCHEALQRLPFSVVLEGPETVNGHRDDSVPIATGMINAGMSCRHIHTHLGGEGFGNCVGDFCLHDFKSSDRGEDPASNQRVIRLHAQCQRALRTPSYSAQATILIDVLFEGIGYACSMSRARFVGSNTDYFGGSMGPVGESLRNNGIDKRYGREVVLNPCATLPGEGRAAIEAGCRAVGVFGTGEAH